MDDLTILIATVNGARLLERTLQGYADQKAPGLAWKLVIVDNGSTDDTAAVIARFQEVARIDRIFAPNPGKNRALNRGVEALESEIIIVSDDDSVPHPGFLTAWRDAFVSQPDAQIFGGSIVPLFDSPAPPWMADTQLKYEELFSARVGVPAGPIDPSRIYGPNMGVRR